jgi:hypothetical protein
MKNYKEERYTLSKTIGVSEDDIDESLIPMLVYIDKIHNGF